MFLGQLSVIDIAQFHPIVALILFHGQYKVSDSMVLFLPDPMKRTVDTVTLFCIYLWENCCICIVVSKHSSFANRSSNKKIIMIVPTQLILQIYLANLSPPLQ